MPLYGTYSAIVVSAQDPQRRGRARLRIPQIMGAAVSGWAEPVTLGATLPGDQVYVSFDGGDRNAPVFWPMVRAGRPGWEPLALAAGWAEGTTGPPMVRLTADGVIELDGSARHSAVTVGTTAKFGALPAGLLPLHRVIQPVATDYRGAFASRVVFNDNRATTTTTSTAFVTDPGGPVCTFVAPGTGAVVANFGSLEQSSTAAGRSIMGVQIRDGSTVITGPEDNRSAENQSANNSSVANAAQYTGLTPGRTYTATAMYRTDVAGTTASFDNKWLQISPTMPYDVPMARVSVEANGDLLLLFPTGHYTPYEASLAGVRARAI